MLTGVEFVIHWIFATIVICNGLGDTADGWIETAEHMASALPYVKFILPTAPPRKVTMNMGMAMPAWYDITGLDKRSNERCDGIDASRARLAKLIDEESMICTNPQASSSIVLSSSRRNRRVDLEYW